MGTYVEAGTGMRVAVFMTTAGEEDDSGVEGKVE